MDLLEEIAQHWLSRGHAANLALEDGVEDYEKSGILRLEKQWRAFAEQESENPLETAPSMALIRAYILYRSTTGLGKLEGRSGERCTDQTWLKKFQQIIRAMKGWDHTYPRVEINGAQDIGSNIYDWDSIN